VMIYRPCLCNKWWRRLKSFEGQIFSEDMQL
jgi:hypothetical protein